MNNLFLIPQFIIDDMQKTLQFSHMNILQHGQDVHQWYLNIKKNINLFSEKSQKILTMIQHPNVDIDLIEQYHVFHDIGKPYCLKHIDGKSSFPEHAQCSHQIFSQYCDHPLINDCILFDMLLHQSTCEEIKIWKNQHQHLDYYHDLSSLLSMTTIAELHSNSLMFGGFESSSFKIKEKKIIRNIHQLINKHCLKLKR